MSAQIPTLTDTTVVEVFVWVFFPLLPLISSVVRSLLLIWLTLQHMTAQTQQATGGTDDARTLILVFSGCVGITNYNGGFSLFILVYMCFCVWEKACKYLIVLV